MSVRPCDTHTRPEFGCDHYIRHVRSMTHEAETARLLADAATRTITVEWNTTVALNGTAIYSAPVPAGWSADDVWEAYETELGDLIDHGIDEALIDVRGHYVADPDDLTTTIGPPAPKPVTPRDDQPSLLDDVS